MDTEELVGEATEILGRGKYQEGLTSLETPGTNPSHDLESVCTEPTEDTNDSLDCTNEDEIILVLFPE
jgi:hypothetical protein